MSAVRGAFLLAAALWTADCGIAAQGLGSKAAPTTQREVLEARGSPDRIRYEPGERDSAKIRAFLDSLFDYYASCPDQYTLNTEYMVDAALRASRTPLCTVLIRLEYPDEDYIIDEAGIVVEIVHKVGPGK